MSDRRSPSSRRPCNSVRVVGEHRPQRSDLSSGGGQVRQSNRSGLSRKSRDGDPSRQTEAPSTPPPSPIEPAPPEREKSPEEVRRERKQGK